MRYPPRGEPWALALRTAACGDTAVSRHEHRADGERHSRGRQTAGSSPLPASTRLHLAVRREKRDPRNNANGWSTQEAASDTSITDRRPSRCGCHYPVPLAKELVFRSAGNPKTAPHCIRRSECLPQRRLFWRPPTPEFLVTTQIRPPARENLPRLHDSSQTRTDQQNRTISHNYFQPAQASPIIRHRHMTI